MYQSIFEELGLSKNEGKIYETLLREGESSVGKIAEKSKVHRRNVYDSMDRLVEKGLVFEILESRENVYQAVDPAKLMELVKEKETKLAKVLPELLDLFNSSPGEEAVYMYRGIEGWKNYFRDVLRVGQDQYIIGASGASKDARLATFFDQFKKEAARKKIKFHILYRQEVLKKPELIGHFGEDTVFKILPEKYSELSSVSVFGDRVLIASATHGVGEITDQTTFTVIVNKDTAETFRTWFQFMWDSLPAYHKGKIK